jgi:hypothetical protein
MMRLVGPAQVCIAGLLTVACAHRDEPNNTAGPAHPAQVETVAQARAPRQSPQFRALMSEHFGFTAAARNSMVRGDLQAVRDALTQLAEYPYTDSVPSAWLPRVRALQEQARAIAHSEKVAVLAHGIADLARGCGDCHRATDGGIAADVVAQEQSTRIDTLPDRMFRHDRAAEQMWLGLIAPSSEAWDDGAHRLANASIEVEIHGDPPTGFMRALHHVRFLGASAGRVEGSIDRARVYGNLLAACADCHRAPTGPLR